jgi:hypothetical protein
MIVAQGDFGDLETGKIRPSKSPFEASSLTITFVSYLA